jgi:hypothetical protein
MLVLLAAAVGSGGGAAANARADLTVKGEVVEIGCSISKSKDGRGNLHAACALDCARRGEPLAVLASDEMYELTGDFAANRNARLLDFVAKSVTITGELSEADGRKRLNVRTIRVN